MNKNGFLHKRAMAAACTFILMQFAQGIYAASTDIADVPMAVKNQVAANIMFTLDDSGSMQFEVMPDMNYSQYLYPQPSGVYGADKYTNLIATFDDSNVHNVYARSAANNNVYYNPDVDYKPWANSDGSQMENASATAAYWNPYNTAAGTMDLTVAQSLSAYWFTHDSALNSAWYACPSSSSYYCAKSFWPITYYNYKGSGSRSSALNYNKVEITSSTPSTSTFTSPGGKVRTKAEEVQNFANWFQYYRSRALAARAGIGRAFSKVGTNPRVGFAAINEGSATIDDVSSPGSIIRGVRAFDSSARTQFFDDLYGHAIPAEGTPLRRAADDVGQYFSRTDSKGPWGTNPGVGGGTQHSCRPNYHILMTDGYWSGGEDKYRARTSDARENVDNQNGVVIAKAPPESSTTYQYTASTPYSDAYSDTLADVAMYYWKRDLRTDLDNNVPTNSKDPAFWQHVTTFTVGLGVTGSVSASTIESAFGATPPDITWPDPTTDDNHKTDDLAHAAINGHGGFFSAADPEKFSNSLSVALNDIASRTGAAAAVAVANANVVGGDNASYASKYDSGTWTGDLQAFPLSLSTGEPDQNAPIWTPSAQSLLDSRTPSNRNIVSYSGVSGADQGIQFQPTSAATTTKLSAAQQALLNTAVTPPGPADAADVVAYLRGERSGELSGTYRSRAHLLGDIVNAEPVVIREPMAKYGDAGYGDFKTASKDRTKVVLQGSNDGMLHAFNAATGAEEWAYVPNLVLGSLNNLSLKTGFTHKYYVDGTPRFRDVDFAKTVGKPNNAAPDWRTIVVGGLGKGGRGYYALDLTTTTGSEAQIASKVLWEFPNSATDATLKASIGYSFGKPVIVKTKASGWVALVTSGYNNGTNVGDSGGDGKGYLFVLNARTGELIKAISTGVGTSSAPSGLAHISGYVEAEDFDATVEYVYGGDLKGNVWRFDLTASNTNQWNVAKLATLKDDTGNFQPITTEPQLAKPKINGVFKRMVYVGTGQYMGDSDIAGVSGANSHATQTQTMYGMIDDLSTPSGTNAVIGDVRLDLQEQTFSVNAAGEQVSSNNAIGTKKGWYIDMPVAGERINTHPALAFNALAFTSNVPNADPCLPGGKSFFNVLDYRSGGFLENSTVAWSRMSLGDALASRAVLVKLPSGKVRALARKSDATTVSIEVPVKVLPHSRRISWRELML